LLLLAVSTMLASAQQEEAAPKPTDADIARLIEQLGDDDFAARDRAQQKLAELGAQAYDALTVAAQHADLEIAARTRYLLQRVIVPIEHPDDPEPVKQRLEGYAQLSMENRLLKIHSLMWLPRGQGCSAACRIVHVERSRMMSKYAATIILNGWPADAEGRRRMRQVVEAELGRSGREAAQWLIQYAALLDDPPTNLEAWRDVVHGENEVARRYPSRTSPRILKALLLNLTSCELAHGDPEQAQQAFRDAQRILLPTTSPTYYFYRDSALFFKARGQFDQAVGVFAMVSAMGEPSLVPSTQQLLSEMYHDMGRNRDAAAALDVTLQLLASPKGASVKKSMADYSTPEQILARKLYFLACTADQDGNDTLQRQLLGEALQADPAELDALIATYQLPDLEEEKRTETVALIDQAAADLLDQAEANPDSASARNQYAWLVGNTTGDMQKALDFSQRAVELDPSAGSYYDTLAHVYYYGLKDYDKAVEAQAKAFELSPHSGLIKKKYDLFRQAVAKPAAEPDSQGDSS
jgi:tetratricopeptide (TPR) repeat protein